MTVLNVRDLLIDRVGVPLTMRRDTLTVITAANGTEVLRGNPARVGFAIINAGGFVVWMAPVRVTAGFAFRLEANGGALITNWEQDGEMVVLPWQGIAVGGASPVQSFEVLIDAKAPRSPQGREG